MSLNTIIRAAIAPVVPVCVPHLYKGSETEYCTFNYTRYPSGFCDNAPISIGYSIQVHYFCPLEGKNGAYFNPNDKLSQIANALFAAGFDYPQIVDVTDDTGQHYVFETGCAEELA